MKQKLDPGTESETKLKLFEITSCRYVCHIECRYAMDRRIYTSLPSMLVTVFTGVDEVWEGKGLL